MPDRPDAPKTATVAYFLTLFPKLSESFVLNEVVEVERRGIRVVPICFDRSRQLERKRHAAADRLKAPVHYVVDGFPAAHTRALASWLARRPAALARLLVRNLRHPAPRGESKLGRFSNSVYAGWLVERSGATHIHAHWSCPGDVAYLVHDLMGVSFSVTVHAHDLFEDIDLYAARGFPFSRRAAAADFIIACTAHNAEQIREQCEPADQAKVHHAYHGLDTSKFRPSERKRSFPDIPLILSVGRMVPYKGFDVIVRACARLHEAGRPVRANFAGSHGSLTELVLEDIRERGLQDYVRVLGPQTQEELVRLYGEADIFVNASNPDGEYGVANVIVEGMASELPTIATHRPQVEEYIEDGVNGFLHNYGDDAELAAMIDAVLDNPQRAFTVASAGRETAQQRFDIDATAERLSALLMQTARAANSQNVII